MVSGSLSIWKEPLHTRENMQTPHSYSYSTLIRVDQAMIPRQIYNIMTEKGKNQGVPVIQSKSRPKLKCCGEIIKKLYRKECLQISIKQSNKKREILKNYNYY